MFNSRGKSRKKKALDTMYTELLHESSACSPKSVPFLIGHKTRVFKPTFLVGYAIYM